MALSEHEQRLLDEMERSLYQSDADYVAAGSGGRPDSISVIVGVLVGVVGLGLVVGGVMAQLPILGIAGFAVMVAGVLIALRRRRGTAELFGSTTEAPPKKPKGGAFISSMEDRWERRREERDGA